MYTSPRTNTTQINIKISQTVETNIVEEAKFIYAKRKGKTKLI